MIEILLTRNKVTIVDDIDQDLNQFTWYAEKKTTYHVESYHAARKQWIAPKYYHVSLSRVIMARILKRTLSSKELVDHINGDSLDNRRENLRLANHSTNGINRGLDKDNTSGYKGVTWNKRKQKYYASIACQKRTYHLGGIYYCRRRRKSL